MGDPYTDITLDLRVPSPRNATFALIGKQIQLIQPLDRDAESLSHILFQVKPLKHFRLLLIRFEQFSIIYAAN